VEARGAVAGIRRGIRAGQDPLGVAASTSSYNGGWMIAWRHQSEYQVKRDVFAGSSPHSRDNLSVSKLSRAAKAL
jgi:phage tail tape-measure protein